MIFKRNKIWPVTAVVVALIFSAANVRAEQPVTRTEVKEIVKEVLDENPELVVQSLEKFRRQQQEEAEARAASKIKEHSAYFKSDQIPMAGNPDGTITLVEFFDYNCGYCKKALPDVLEALKNTPELRIAFLDMPILSPDSELAARWALAADKQGKYLDFHVELMAHKGRHSEESLVKLSEKLGLDVERMKEDAVSEETQKILSKNMQVAQDIGVRGTPAFVIGETLYRGYLGEGGLVGAIENAQKKTGDS